MKKKLGRSGIFPCLKAITWILGILTLSSSSPYSMQKGISTGAVRFPVAIKSEQRSHFQDWTAAAPLWDAGGQLRRISPFAFLQMSPCGARPEIEVNDHDFHIDALGIAILYGVYDTQGNSGCMYVGTTCDTPRFAVDCIEAWWQNIGCMRYPHADNLLILADCGGSNGYRSRVWKYKIHQLCQRYNLTVHVCHYPPGTSKWNPIEHRLFSEISKNWAGEPLVSYETVINHICTTKKG